MRVAVLNAPRRLELVEEPLREPDPGELLLRVASCGVCASELEMWQARSVGGEFGFGPWSLVWWWIQNEEDPLKRLTVTNCWDERDLMRTLRRWRREAQDQGLERIADLYDYLQADERMHVRLATDWIRRLADDEHQFTFMKDGARDDHRGPVVIGE